jgi:uncharacterized protein
MPMIRVSVVLLAAQLVGMLATGAQIRRRPVIDVHLHALPANSVADEVAIPGLDRAPTDEAVMEESRNALERENVIKAVTSGAAAMVARWNAAVANRLIAARFIGIIPAPDGGRAEWPVLGELRAAHRDGKLQVLGEIGAQYMGLTLSSPEFEPYLALAEELDIPVAVHTGSGPPGAPYQISYPKFRAALGNPLLIEDALVRHPKLRLYIMHGGYPFLAETLTLLTVYPQVYVDLAAINWVLPRDEFHSYLGRLVQAGFADRLMFGSDQMVWPQTIRLGIDAIQTAGFLTESQKRGVLCVNAARFLRLELAICD